MLLGIKDPSFCGSEREIGKVCAATLLIPRDTLLYHMVFYIQWSQIRNVSVVNVQPTALGKKLVSPLSKP